MSPGWELFQVSSLRLQWWEFQIFTHGWIKAPDPADSSLTLRFTGTFHLSFHHVCIRGRMGSRECGGPSETRLVVEAARLALFCCHVVEGDCCGVELCFLGSVCNNLSALLGECVEAAVAENKVSLISKPKAYSSIIRLTGTLLRTVSFMFSCSEGHHQARAGDCIPQIR